MYSLYQSSFVRMFAICVVVVAVALGAVALTPIGVVNADELDFDNIGWFEGGGCGDCGFFDSGWGSTYDYGCYDCGYDYGDSGCYYDCSTGDIYCDDCGYSYDGCYDSCGYEWDYDCDCYSYDYDDYEVEEYEDFYYDDECDCYSYGSSGSSGGGMNFGGFGGGFRTGGGYPISVPSPKYPSFPQSSSHVTNTNITTIDNSINDSFNNYNSNNVSYLAPVTPQYPVVYTQPAPYCTIHQAQASGYGVNAAYLSWSSTNATSAYLSNVGMVSVNGSQSVWPTYTSVYTLTVYGANGQSATCATTVYANTYTTPNAPYVSLTQIPYTGFDLGVFGNTMYWVGLALFAMGAAYLAVYYTPKLVLAGARSETKFAPVVAPKAPILIERETAKVAPIVAQMRKTGTADSMAIVASKDGSMPKIVISRA